MNPFTVLNVNRYASNKEIIHAAALGMRNKKHSAKELAQAQKMLLDPVSRACQEFLHFADLKDSKARLFQKITENSIHFEGPGKSDNSQLKRLNNFEQDHEH